MRRRKLNLNWLKKNDAIYAWGNKFDGLYVPLDDSIQRVVSEILKEHPRLIDTRKNRSGADPFVIALASVHKCAGGNWRAQKWQSYAAENSRCL